MSGVRNYPASRDASVRVVTAFVFLLTFMLPLSYFIPGGFGESGAPLALMITGVFLLVVIVVMYFYSPVGYALDGKNIIIRRKAGNRFISADHIKTVRLPAEKELAYAIRTFGNGGIFGYTGYYYSKGAGKMEWFCTRRDRQVIIERKAGLKIVITPDDPVAFVNDYLRS